MVSSNPAIHLAIIPDGNRRWAKKQLLKPWEGHQRALENSRDLIDWCRQNDQISILTLWGFSTENWNREPREVSALMSLFVKYLKDQQASLHQHQTRFIHSGRRDRIPKNLAQLITKIEEETKNYTKFTFHLAVDYGGRDEILRAVNKIKKQPVTAENFRQYLDHPELPDIDFVIRTSGEHRASGFFIWQAAYAEWCFETKPFPELKPDDLAQHFADFKKRHRRFGA
jgi:undecaprenyl diphosphate synthase